MKSGILPGHIPFITLLKPGTIQIKTSNGNDEMVYQVGVLEITTAFSDGIGRYGSIPGLTGRSQIWKRVVIPEINFVQPKADIDTLAFSGIGRIFAQLQTLQKFKNRA